MLLRSIIRTTDFFFLLSHFTLVLVLVLVLVLAQRL